MVKGPRRKKAEVKDRDGECSAPPRPRPSQFLWFPPDTAGMSKWVMLFVGCFNIPATCSCISRQMCSDKFMCCNTEIEVADQTFYLTQPQYTDTGPTSPSTDPITPGPWQCSHWMAILKSVWPDLEKSSWCKGELNPRSFTLVADALTARWVKRFKVSEEATQSLSTLEKKKN